MAADAHAISLAAKVMAALDNGPAPVAPDFSAPSLALPSQTNNPLYETIEALDVEKLTTGAVNGSGAFDKLMMSVKAHLDEQFQKGRITADQFARAYVEMTTAAMSAGVQLVLGAETTRWQAALIQAQARKAEIDAVQAAVQLELTKAQYALILVQIVGEDVKWRVAEAQIGLTEAQADLAEKQVELTDKQIDQAEEQIGLTREQKETTRAQTSDTRSDGAAVTGSVGKQKALVDAQIGLVVEQKEAARAQTLDVRSDGAAVAGSVGKQKTLYEEQVQSYRKDAAQKAAKTLVDVWAVQKTVDEGMSVPDSMTNANISTAVANLRTMVGV